MALEQKHPLHLLGFRQLQCREILNAFKNLQLKSKANWSFARFTTTFCRAI